MTYGMSPGEMKDSGERDTFATGAVRDAATGKPRIDLVSPFALRRLGVWLAKGAEKYTPRNWERGIPISRCVESLCRHVESLKAGDQDEDHAAAIMCNAMFILHFEEMVAAGVLPLSLLDMPDYKPDYMPDCKPRLVATGEANQCCQHCRR